MEIAIGDIVDGLAAQVRAQLKAAGGRPVVLRIHSVGGSVLEGLSLFDAIASYPGHVKAVVEGGALSMGSILALAADETEITENSFVMIHDPSYEDEGDMSENDQATLEKLRERLLSIYEQRTALDRDGIEMLMDEERFMGAEEAVEYGFASRVIPTTDRSIRAVQRLQRASAGYRLAVASARSKSASNAKALGDQFKAAIAEARTAGVPQGKQASWIEARHPGLRAKYVQAANAR